MSKVLEGLAHELLAAAHLAPGEGISDGIARLSALLAKPAEAEGVDVIGYMDGDYRRDQPSIYIPHVRIVKSCAKGEALMTVTQHLAALSAVTAERDRLRKDRDDCLEARQYYADKYGEVIAERERLRAELEMLRDNNRKAAISDAAMASKEA